MGLYGWLQTAAAGDERDEFTAGKDGIEYIGDDEEIKKIVDEMGIGDKEEKSNIMSKRCSAFYGWGWKCGKSEI